MLAERSWPKPPGLAGWLAIEAAGAASASAVTAAVTNLILRDIPAPWFWAAAAFTHPFGTEQVPLDRTSVLFRGRHRTSVRFGGRGRHRGLPFVVRAPAALRPMLAVSRNARRPTHPVPP